VFVERFMAWSVAAGVEQRSKAISELAGDLLTGKVAEQDEPDCEQILTLYLDDPNTRVRRALASAVAPHSHAPRTLIWALAEDVAEVAEPIFATSPILRSKDLVHAAVNGEELLQSAVARREDIDGAVCRALVEKGLPLAICGLLENKSVVLGPGLKHDIAVRLGDVPEVRELLLASNDLAARTRQILVERLSTSLLSFATGKGWAEESKMANVTRDACNRVAIDIAGQTDPDNMPEFVQHLRDTDQLTPALLVRAACHGNAAMLENTFALLSGKSLSKVQSIIDANRPSAFRSLYSRTGLPEAFMPVFRAAIETWRNPVTELEAMAEIITRVENDAMIDGATFALLGRIESELKRKGAKTYERPLLLAA